MKFLNGALPAKLLSFKLVIHILIMRFLDKFFHQDISVNLLPGKLVDLMMGVWGVISGEDSCSIYI